MFIVAFVACVAVLECPIDKSHCLIRIGLLSCSAGVATAASSQQNNLQAAGVSAQSSESMPHAGPSGSLSKLVSSSKPTGSDCTQPMYSNLNPITMPAVASATSLPMKVTAAFQRCDSATDCSQVLKDHLAGDKGQESISHTTAPQQCSAALHSRDAVATVPAKAFRLIKSGTCHAVYGFQSHIKLLHTAVHATFCTKFADPSAEAAFMTASRKQRMWFDWLVFAAVLVRLLLMAVDLGVSSHGVDVSMTDFAAVTVKVVVHGYIACAGTRLQPVVRDILVLGAEANSLSVGALSQDVASLVGGAGNGFSGAPAKLAQSLLPKRLHVEVRIGLCVLAH